MRTVYFLISLSLLAGINTQKNTPESGAIMKKLTPNMMVEDVFQTVEYYRNTMGFVFIGGVLEDSQEPVSETDPEKPLAFAMIKQGEVQVMLQSTRSLSEELPAMADKPIGASMTFYIEVDDAEKWYSDIKDRVKLIKPLHTKFYGMKEFYFTDINGYVLTIASKVAKD